MAISLVTNRIYSDHFSSLATTSTSSYHIPIIEYQIQPTPAVNSRHINGAIGPRGPPVLVVTVDEVAVQTVPAVTLVTRVSSSKGAVETTTSVQKEDIVTEAMNENKGQNEDFGSNTLPPAQTTNVVDSSFDKSPTDSSSQTLATSSPDDEASESSTGMSRSLQQALVIGGSIASSILVCFILWLLWRIKKKQDMKRKVEPPTLYDATSHGAAPTSSTWLGRYAMKCPWLMKTPRARKLLGIEDPPPVDPTMYKKRGFLRLETGYLAPAIIKPMTPSPVETLSTAMGVSPIAPPEPFATTLRRHMSAATQPLQRNLTVITKPIKRARTIGRSNTNIRKDGHVAGRSNMPLNADQLDSAILQSSLRPSPPVPPLPLQDATHDTLLVGSRTQSPYNEHYSPANPLVTETCIVPRRVSEISSISSGFGDLDIVIGPTHHSFRGESDYSSDDTWLSPNHSPRRALAKERSGSVHTHGSKINSPERTGVAGAADNTPRTPERRRRPGVLESPAPSTPSQNQTLYLTPPVPTQSRNSWTRRLSGETVLTDVSVESPIRFRTVQSWVSHQASRVWRDNHHHGDILPVSPKSPSNPEDYRQKSQI